ncbi:MAG: RdgB/HAM1 family non-canonical purine NTP pyrophosphatase [Actinomycetes bacterium]
MSPRRVVLATRNPAKLVELRRILTDAGTVVDLVGAAELPGVGDVSETGLTFTENALLKAGAVHAATGLPTVADDSGICVAALGGMPGVFSARWAGRHGDDEANLRLLLGQLADVPDDRLSAYFACAAAFVDASGEQHVVRAEVHGHLVRAPRGHHGFGYDPVFVPDGYTCTTAELEPVEKDAISHRGKALRALVSEVASLL